MTEPKTPYHPCRTCADRGYHFAGGIEITCSCPAGEAYSESTPEWLIVLLTEVSAALYGHGNLKALDAAVREAPEPYLRDAGLRWAISSFDDQAPTREQMERWPGSYWDG